MRWSAISTLWATPRWGPTRTGRLAHTPTRRPNTKRSRPGSSLPGLALGATDGFVGACPDLWSSAPWSVITQSWSAYPRLARAAWGDGPQGWARRAGTGPSGPPRSPTSTPATTQLVATAGSRRGRWRRGRRVGAHTGGIANSGPRGDLVGVVGPAPAPSRRASSLRPWTSPPPAQLLPGPVGAAVVHRPPGRQPQPHRHVPRRRGTDRELTRAPLAGLDHSRTRPAWAMRGWSGLSGDRPGYCHRRSSCRAPAFPPPGWLSSRREGPS